MTKQPGENTNASAEEEQAAKRRVMPEPLLTEQDEVEVDCVARALTNDNAAGPDELNHAREVVRSRKKATHHA